MGFTRYLEGTKPLTLTEVVTAVHAIKTVAERLKDDFKIIHETRTEIAIEVRSDNPVEGFMFKPVRSGGGFFVLEFTSCKTNSYREDTGIKEMISALKKVLRRKLKVHRT